MPTVEVPAQLTVEHLMAAIRQLTPAEWSELQRQLHAWQERDDGPIDSEEELLARFRENSRLPEPEQRRFDRLRRARQTGALSASDEAELFALWDRVEQMNVTRLESLTRLARLRGTDVRSLMKELGVPEEPGVL